MPDSLPPYPQRPYSDSQSDTSREQGHGQFHAGQAPQTLQPPAPTSVRVRPDQRKHHQRQNEASETKQNNWRFGKLRSRDSDPVKRASDESAKRGAAAFNWRSKILVALCTALGIGSVQIADQRAFHGLNYGTSLYFFWCGLVLILLPIALRATMRGTHQAERIALILLLGAALYMVKVESSPYTFTYNDEYIHWANTQHILNNGRIFQYNALLPTVAYYPGLAAVTASLVHLTGLSIFVSGLIVIGVTRIVISACFYLAAERLTGSSRAASVAGILYAANPMFLFWSSQFAYEDLGLPLAAFAIWWLYTTRKSQSRMAQIVTVLAIGAVTVTHHVSAFALSGILAMWFFAELITRKPGEQRRYVGAFALLSGAVATIWFFFVAHPAASYMFDDNIKPTLEETKALLTGHASRHLYSGGVAPPTWFILLGFAAIALIILALPLALYRAWCIFAPGGKNNVLYRRAPLAVAAIIAVSFPFTLLPRLTSVGSAVSARTSEYVFMGLGCVLGLLAVEPAISYLQASNRLQRTLGKLFRPADFMLTSWRGTSVLTAMLTVIFFGEIAVGNTYFQLLPPSSNPSGFPWIVQPDVINASIWARDHLGINQPFATDFVDSLALVTYGDENTKPEDEVFAIFFGNSLVGLPAQLIKESGTRYILVDWRMTYGMPSNPGDYYFSEWEPNAGNYTKPFSGAYLKKFTTYTCSRMIYESGPVQIFDVSGIADGTCTPKLTATASRVVHPSPDQDTSSKRGSL